MLQNFISDPFPNVLGFLLVGFILFLLFRELVTWYWKLNRIIELLEEIEENTRPEGKNLPTPESNKDDTTKVKQPWW